MADQNGRTDPKGTSYVLCVSGIVFGYKGKEEQMNMWQIFR